MTPLEIILVGMGLLAFSGVPGLLLSFRSSASECIATVLAVPGAFLGLFGAVLALWSDGGCSQSGSWLLPGAAWSVELDSLGAFFLVPVFLVSGLGSIYGRRYWPQSDHPTNGRRLRFFWGLLPAGMTILILARNAVLFLFGWEVMALSAFFLVATEHDKPEVQRAAWLYIAAAHVATLCLFAMFSIFHKITGTFAMRPLAEHEASLGILTVLYALILVAFGLKAGLMPFHIWLPSAHANAPSHVSAMLSGIVLKMGIYGLVRFLGYLPAPPTSWGALLLLLGVVSGVLGVAFAMGQHDLKRLLAYHSVENIGIIVIGLGLAMLGRSLNRPDWILFGMAGCLLHVWNHGLFKSLLFLCTGPVVHAVHSREIDLMGGLAKPMPITSGLFLIGAVAICGLPPLNGFVSELIIYVGLFRTMDPAGGPLWTPAALAIPCLALIGALALACFVKAYGAVFLGEPRAPRPAHEPSFTITGPIFVLAACCLLIGLAPSLFIPPLERIASAWPANRPPSLVRIESTLPLGWIGNLGMVLLGGIAAAGVLLSLRWRRRDVASAGTWDCGYARPSARMQYRSSSFAQMVVRLFRIALRPRTHRPAIQGAFPGRSHFESHVDDVVLDGLIVPFLKKLAGRIGRIRVFQHGRIQEYILYILVALLLLLLFVLPIDEFVRKIFNR